jgi:hypothetical protein
MLLPSNVVSLASKPQPGRPNLSIYVPQWEGGPIIPPDTGFTYRRHLLLARLRWRTSNPPTDVIFLSNEPSVSWGPIQPRIQWVPGLCPRGEAVGAWTWSLSSI